MKIIFGITTVLLLAVFSVAYLYFSNLNVDSRSNDKILAVIPADASVIFNFSNDKGFYEIFKDYPVFKDIVGKAQQDELSWMKEMLLDNGELYASTREQKVFLSFHALSSDTISYLWTMPLQKQVSLVEISGILKKRSGEQFNISNQEGSSILEVRSNATGKVLNLGIDKGIARASFSKSLLQESLSSQSKKISKEFISEINTSLQKNGNDLANIFINHGEPGFLKPFFKQNPAANFGLFNSFAAYSNLILNYKSDALMFNGSTRITDKHNGYLNLFLKQQPVRNTIKRTFSNNTSNAIAYGLSDYKLFHKDLLHLFEMRKELKQLDEEIALIATETGIQAERDIKVLWGNEFANVQLSTYENLAIVQVSNGRQLQFLLEPLSTNYSEVIRKMNYANLFYFYFGDPLKKYNKPFFSVIDNLLILSNSASTIQRFLNDYNSDRPIANSESFVNFDKFVADQSNISFFLQFSNSKSLLGSVLERKYSKLLDDKSYGFKDFYALSYQLTSNKNYFFTNFYLGYKSSLTGQQDSIVYKTDRTNINRP